MALNRKEWRASQVELALDNPDIALTIHASIVNDQNYLDKLALLDTIHAEIDPSLDARRLAYFEMVIPPKHDSYIDLMDKTLLELAKPLPA
jgi:hypothetical protein